MSIPEDPGQPLQKLPAGMPRRYAEYKPVTSDAVEPPPTNVGGYDELLSYFQERGQTLPRKAESLATLDQAINDGLPAELARPIGMFYGDLLTHTVPGAHCGKLSRRDTLWFVSPGSQPSTLSKSRYGAWLPRSPPSNKTMPTSSNSSGTNRRGLAQVSPDRRIRAVMMSKVIARNAERPCRSRKFCTGAHPEARPRKRTSVSLESSQRHCVLSA
jgi:hypothetical protein